MKNVLLILLPLFGFCISFYIWNKVHREKKKLVCIIGKGTCENVVKSKYASMFGIDNTILGMAYYFFIFIMAVLFFVAPRISLTNYLYLAEILVTGTAALASLILISIQLFVLKKKCEYCMIANVTNIAIFLVVLF